MKLHFSLFFAVISLLFGVVGVSAQAESIIGQITNSSAEVFIGGVSGDGRFVVFESKGDLATENPRNADGNLEIFLFDYAQRRIFQITDTKSVLYDDKGADSLANVRVEIVNTRPVISNDGKFIAFSSNATASTPAAPDSTNPGSFNGNAFTSPTPTPTPTPATTPTPSATPTPTPTPGANPLTNDGNLEMWIYQIPAYAPVADLSAGDEIPFTDLSGGTFTRVTNTDTSQLPRGGTTTVGPFVADDNHDASINDDGSRIAFVSTRNLVACVGNASPDVNDEIFTFTQGGGSACGDGTSPGIQQITKTPRGVISNPIFNKNVTISGSGVRLVFASTGENPINGFPACGANPVTSRNEEIFYADLDVGSGAPTSCNQITTTTPTNAGDPVNILDLGRRMSRDGRYIAFDSHADLTSENGGTNFTSFALFLYDTTTNTFRRIGPRSDADSGATGGDIQHFPGFTDTDGSGTPSTLVLETRENIKADGTIPTTATDGLNSDTTRPAQIYSYPLNVPSATATFTRAAKFPPPSTFLASTQPIPTNSIARLVFNIALTEFGTGNSDLQSEAYYLLRPANTGESTLNLNFATGATNLPILPSVAPTPTPSPMMTPTPTPTPTPTGSPTPTPPPVTPTAVTGISPGMVALLTFDVGADQPITSRTAVGSLLRRFNLPLELSGVTLSINGLGCGLESVSPHQIVFVVPPFISSSANGTQYDLVLNNNGNVVRSKITIVPTRPDIFNLAGVIGPGGRAKLFNITNRVFTTEPFTVTTVKTKGGVRVPTVLRLYATGIANGDSSVFTIRIGSVSIAGASVLTGGIIREPGVYTLDFTLPSTLNGAGDQPVVLSVNVNGTVFQSRLDDTTSFVRIL